MAPDENSDDLLESCGMSCQAFGLWKVGRMLDAVKTCKGQAKPGGIVAQNMIEFTEAAGKAITKITVTNEAGFQGVSVYFTDQTALHFAIDLQIAIKPALLDWSTGDAEIVKEYPIIEQPNA
jgi:hypothetical protein